MNDLNLLKKQAKYIDEKTKYLDMEVPVLLLRPSSEAISDAEKILSELSTGNKELLESIEEERSLGKHNIEEVAVFLKSVQAETENMTEQLQAMEKQLEEYGYVPTNGTLEGTYIIENGNA